MKRPVKGLYSLAATGKNREIKEMLSLLSEPSRIAKLNLPNRYGFTPLHSAIFHEHYSTIELLVNLGANVNQRAIREQWTYPLHLAASIGSHKVVKLLIASKADIFLCDWEGFTALNCADAVNNKAIASLLRKSMDIATKSYLLDMPRIQDQLTSGWDDAWWRSRRVYWDDDDDPIVADHYSDGGAEASDVFKRIEKGKKQCATFKKLYRVMSQPLTICELQRARDTSSSKPLKKQDLQSSDTF